MRYLTPSIDERELLKAQALDRGARRYVVATRDPRHDANDDPADDGKVASRWMLDVPARQRVT